jgi:predicted amidohydrolase
MPMLKNTLHVGIIQTSLDYEAAWQNSDAWDDTVRMSYFEEKRAKKEIRHYLASLYALEKKPDIILLPELSVPLGYENKLKRSAEAMESIIIAGLDYKVENKITPAVSNEAIVIVPRKIRGKKIARRTEIRRIGKTYAAPEEENKLKALGVNFKSHPTVWLFESPDFGTFGVAVCYDFMDLDRIVLYRNKIQTLFVLAYNRDITSFDHIAQSIARTVFCNVIISNCGYYGGSLAVSPYRDSYKRTVYQHSGAKLTNAQIVELPLRALKDHQDRKPSSKHFKNLPPGFPTKHTLTVKNETVEGAK